MGLGYDADGNLTTWDDGTAAKRYTYDAENRLITVEPATPASGDTKVGFFYDYLGRRVGKVVFQYVSGAWTVIGETLFLYDGWNLIQERYGDGQVKRSYVWGLDLSDSLQGAGGIGGLVFSTDGLTSYHYLYDANGNVGQLVDTATGAVTAHYEYDPFGNVTYATGPADNPFRFSTKYHDDETGLVYYGYRYYSPELGRWVTRDPIEEEGGINFYQFVGNDGVSFFDAYGLRIFFRVNLLGNMYIFGGLGGGFALAESDCVNGKMYMSKYVVVVAGLGLSVNVNISKISRLVGYLLGLVSAAVNVMVPDYEFDISLNLPPMYYSHLLASGPSVGFVYSVGIGQVGASFFPGFSGPVQAFPRGPNGQVGVSAGSVDAIHLFRISEKQVSCCP
ncbi:MAG: RHS repeat-associated core domain-containing protein [Deltaproteobacteria bacterium]|nr:RHS repeat-associated core domain-containing protein [Deltaproteobacteria bacterium]